MERVYDDYNDWYIIKDEYGYSFAVLNNYMISIAVDDYKLNFKDEFKGKNTDIYYMGMKYDLYKSDAFKCLFNDREFYVEMFTLMIFFYDSLPLEDNLYMITPSKSYLGCPLYFTVNFNESITKCGDVKWYHINETYINGKTIECIGKSPYRLKDDKIVQDCNFAFTDQVCKGLSL